MGTRGHIVIKKKINDDETSYLQMYEHWDTYPSGVGKAIQNTIKGICDSHPITETNIPEFSTPEELGKVLGYEIEGDSISLHSDIQYLYVIDIDEQTITCFAVEIYDDKNHHSSPDMDFITGKATETKPFKFNPNSDFEWVEEKQVYCSGFDDSWEDIVNNSEKDLDDIGCCINDDEK